MELAASGPGGSGCMANCTGEDWQNLATSVELAWQAEWSLASVYHILFIYYYYSSLHASIWSMASGHKEEAGWSLGEPLFFHTLVCLPASVRGRQGRHL